MLDNLLSLISTAGQEPTVLSGTPMESMERSLKGLLKDNRPTGVFARVPYCMEIR